MEAEKDVFLNRVREFKIGIRCIVDYLEGRQKNWDGEIPVFRLSDGEINGGRIYWMMMRECRHLDDGLPIYACRQAILKQIHYEQVLLTLMQFDLCMYTV